MVMMLLTLINPIFFQNNNKGGKKMKLKDFLFNPDFNAFTRLLTKEILQFEKNTACKFTPVNKRNYTQWLPHEDFFEWDPCPNDICFGRYYQYQPPPQNTANAEIWIGLEILKTEIFFSVWIEKTSAPNYDSSFIKKYGQNTNISILLKSNTSTDYFIIRLVDKQFTDYISSVKGISGNTAGLTIVQDFLKEVLF
jgi:hypothetical protein